MARSNSAKLAEPLQPKRDGEMAAFFKAVDAHPDSKEISTRVAGLQLEVESRGVQSVTHWSCLRHGSIDALDKVRRKLHDDIADAIVKPESREAKRPLGIFVLGPPGSGKTSLAVPYVESRFRRTFTDINPDDVKERLPEYEGWNAMALHEESSYVAKGLVSRRGRDRRCNLLMDVTGRSLDEMARAIEELAGYGYEIHTLLMALPAWQSACRVWNRFQENPFGRVDPSKPGSRYVSPYYAYKIVGGNPNKTYRALKTHKDVSGFCRIDSTGLNDPKNPRIVEQRGWLP